MNIGIIGSGAVAQALADGFTVHGHAVRLGTRDPSQLADFVAARPTISADTPRNTAEWAEIAVLAVKGKAALAVVQDIADALAGKPVMDTTNPIADGPPTDGVLPFFTGPNDSLLERLQAAAPRVHFVKAFNSVGSGDMANPSFNGGPPTMFIAGDETTAKRAVSELVQQLGWEVADMGVAVAARAIEPLCMLWCIPGFRDNDWHHAFRLLR